MEYFVFLFMISLAFANAFAQDNMPYAKEDWGERLSNEECQKRIDIISANFEPMLNLAKLKAENHPAFKKIVENQSYELIESGVRAIEDSENCNSPLPSFEMHYATDILDDSYTRIYVSMDYVSYDVLKIHTRHIGDKFYSMPGPPQPLPFNTKNWDELQIRGADPPIPSQTFKFPYTIVSGKIKSIQSQDGGIKVDLTSREDANGIFAFKVPRNYPYTDHNDEASGHPGHGLEVFTIFHNPARGEISHVTKSDCFYDVWIPFSGNATIEFAFQISYLIGGWSFHGDDDLPRYCLQKTMVDESLEKQAAKSPLRQLRSGNAVSSYDVICSDGLKLVVKNDGKSACVTEKTSRSLWERNLLARSTDIYSEYSSKEIRERFQKKLIQKEQALQIAHDFVKEKNLVLRQDIDETKLQIDAYLAYAVLSKGYTSLLDVDYRTGLPINVMPPWWDAYYTTPQWYSEMQKDYLGLDSKRIEDGHVIWGVSYRLCQNCISDHPRFYIDAVTGKVIQAANVDAYFEPRYEN